jgi:hypothetical protein
MNKPNQAEYDAARAQAEEIGKRAKSDPAFAEQIKRDPVAALRAAGLSDGAIADLLKAEDAAPEVVGHDWDYPCWYTCWYGTSYCVWTGWIY